MEKERERRRQSARGSTLDEAQFDACEARPTGVGAPSMSSEMPALAGTCWLAVSRINSYGNLVAAGVMLYEAFNQQRR